MKHILTRALVLGLVGLTGCATTMPPATVASVDHGQEVARLVAESDEVVSVLRNGMTVIAKRVHSPAVSVRAIVRAGSMDEGRLLGGGLSHLLEHLVAFGTNARRTEAQDRQLLQAIGNNSNAYTDIDHTTYFVNTVPENLDQAIDLVSGWVLTCRVTDDEFAREHQVVQREVEMDEGDPAWVFSILSVRNRYRVSPVGVPIIGYKSVIQGLTRDDVYAYYQSAYRPNNVTFVVAGDMDPQLMLRMVQKHVRDAPAGAAMARSAEEEPPVLAPRSMVATFPKLGQAKLQLAFPSIRLSDPDLYALDLLATVLGRGEGSLLVQELRDKQQLVSSVSVWSSTPHYIEGTFTIDLELDAQKIGAATAATISLLDQIKANGVDPQRLERAKAQMRAARAFSQQTAESVASTVGYDWLSTGDLHFSDNYTQRLAKVTSQEAQNVARKYLDADRLITTALVDEEATDSAGLPKAADLLRGASATSRPTTRQAEGAVVSLELEDGTTVLLKRMTTAPIVSMQLWALGGLSIEDAKTNGLGNLAMKLSPRGTKTRSASQIGEFFDSIGGEMSTGCANNTWSWQAQCLSADFGGAFEVFADVVKNPVFPDSELAPMKERVLGAIKGQDADWFSGAMRFFRAAYFGPGKSPYQFLAIGSEATVKGFTVAQVRDWYSRTIRPARRVLAIYGDVDPGAMEKAVVAQFGPRKPGSLSKAGAGSLALGGGNSATPSIDVQRVQINKTDNPQAAVIIGFDSGSSVADSRQAELALADTMTSGYGYPTGYIFETLRGRGLVYDANAYDLPGRSADLPGCFIAYAGCEPRNVSQVIDAILLNVARLQGSDRDIDTSWFERSKKLAITSDALDHEAAAAQAQTAALDELHGLGYMHHARFADRIKAVSLPDVRELAKARLSRCVVTVSTCAPELVNVKPGVRKYGEFPPVDLSPKGGGHDAGK